MHVCLWSFLLVMVHRKEHEQSPCMGQYMGPLCITTRRAAGSRIRTSYHVHERRMHVYFRCVYCALHVCSLGLQSVYIFRGRVVGQPFLRSIDMAQYPVPSDPIIRLPQWVGQRAPPDFLIQLIKYSAELMMFLWICRPLCQRRTEIGGAVVSNIWLFS